MSPDKMEQMNRQYAGKRVQVDARRPELTRFAGLSGRVVAVNQNGRAAKRGLTGEAVLLVIAADDAGLRVDVHDGSADLPIVSGYVAEADAETGRGLLLVTSLSAEWGFYRTAGGKAVYFTLEVPPDVDETAVDVMDGRDPRSVS